MKVKGLIATHVNGSYTAVDERETALTGNTAALSHDKETGSGK